MVPGQQVPGRLPSQCQPQQVLSIGRRAEHSGVTPGFRAPSYHSPSDLLRSVTGVPRRDNITFSHSCRIRITLRKITVFFLAQILPYVSHRQPVPYRLGTLPERRDVTRATVGRSPECMRKSWFSPCQISRLSGHGQSERRIE
jgi:hypothetical protein